MLLFEQHLMLVDQQHCLLFQLVRLVVQAQHSPPAGRLHWLGQEQIAMWAVLIRLCRLEGEVADVSAGAPLELEGLHAGPSAG